jgi:hypothetical protein
MTRPGASGYLESKTLLLILWGSSPMFGSDSNWRKQTQEDAESIFEAL